MHGRVRDGARSLVVQHASRIGFLCLLGCLATQKGKWRDKFTMTGAFLGLFSSGSPGIDVETTHIRFEHTADVLGKGGATAPAIG